jgi:hypothetical protein
MEFVLLALVLILLAAAAYARHRLIRSKVDRCKKVMTGFVAECLRNGHSVISDDDFEPIKTSHGAKIFEKAYSELAEEELEGLKGGEGE